MKGLDEIKEIERSISKGDVIGIVFGVMGALAIGLTIYSMTLNVKVSKLNIRKLNSEGFN